MQGSQTAIFTFPLEIAMIPVAVAAVSAVLAVLLFRKRGIRRFGFIFLFLALVAGGVIAPMMFTDHITATPREISTNKGFWFNRWKEGFIYDNVEFIVMTSSRDSGGRWTATWQIHNRDGRTQEIGIGDLWKSNEDRIRTLIESHGVTFVDARANRPSYFGADTIRLIIMSVIVIGYLTFYFWQKRYSARAAATGPAQTTQKGKTFTLFRFDLPEIAALPEPDREKVMASCWAKQAVQAAYNRYWQRPGQWAMAPCVIIAVYGAIKDISLGRILIWAVPTTLALFLLIRPYYKRKLIETIQCEVRAEIAREHPRAL